MSAVVSKSIFITGAARSGTTIMGNLIYSFKDVEYLYEPPMLFSLIPIIDQMNTQDWRLLFETYLFEDFLVDAIAGRRINLNLHDNSCIYHAKADEEVKRRLSRFVPKQDAYHIARRRRVVVKMPDILPFIGRIIDFYPDIQLLVTVRRPETVIASLLKRNWFSDETLRESVMIWPSKEGFEMTVPSWLPEELIQQWFVSSEVERCCLYYLIMYESVVSLASCLVVDYDLFVENPNKMMDHISSSLKLDYGTKTTSILSSVAYQSSSSHFDMDTIPVKMRNKLLDIYEQCKVRSLV